MVGYRAHGIALGCGTILIELINTLVEKGALSREEARSVIQRADIALAPQHTVSSTEARKLIKDRILPRFS
jgi:polyhydroxyalkanoate synthesis regulator phasin